MWFNDIYFIPPTSATISGGKNESRPKAFGISGEENFSRARSFTISGEESK